MAAPAVLRPSAGPTTPTVWDEARALGRLAVPLAGGNLLQMATYAIDVVFVAKLGTVDFAAATIGVFLFSMALWALVGLTGGCAPLIAAELGRRRHAVRDVRRSVRMALWLAVLAGVPFSVLLWHGGTVLRFAGQEAEVARRAGGFLRILVWALIPGVAASVMRTAVAALGRPGWALAITVWSLLVGLFANWLLVFGHLGMPALGLSGSAMASLASATAMAAAYMAVLLLDRRVLRYRLLGCWWRFDRARLGELARIGLPIAITYTFEGALFGGASLLMGLIGVAEVAAHAVALNIAALAFQVPLGISQAATIRVGAALGAGNRAAVGRAGWVAVTAGTGFMALTAAAMLIAPSLFVSAFLDVDRPADVHVVALALRFLSVAAAFQLVDGAQAVLAGALRGLRDTRVPMIVAGVGYWGVGFGTAVLLGFGAGWGGVGCGSGSPPGWRRCRRCCCGGGARASGWAWYPDPPMNFATRAG